MNKPKQKVLQTQSSKKLLYTVYTNTRDSALLKSTHVIHLQRNSILQVPGSDKRPAIPSQPVRTPVSVEPPRPAKQPPTRFQQAPLGAAAAPLYQPLVRAAATWALPTRARSCHIVPPPGLWLWRVDGGEEWRVEGSLDPVERETTVGGGVGAAGCRRPGLVSGQAGERRAAGRSGVSEGCLERVA